MRLAAIFAAVASVLGFLAGWNVQAWRYQAAQADALQAQADKKDENATTADTAAQAHEADKAATRVEFRTVYRDVEKIVERPVYRSQCLDADGLRALSRAIGASAPAASEPAATVRGPAASD